MSILKKLFKPRKTKSSTRDLYAEWLKGMRKGDYTPRIAKVEKELTKRRIKGKIDLSKPRAVSSVPSRVAPKLKKKPTKHKSSKTGAWIWKRLV